MDPKIGRGEGKSLTRREFDEVIRRASEMSPHEGDGDLDESELFRIAREVGLPEQHVRIALGEMRSGATLPAARSGYLGPKSVQAVRVVPGTPEELAKKLDDFLVSGSLLRQVRSGASLRSYRPADDFTSELVRGLGGKRHYIATAKNVEVRISRESEQFTRLELDVEPGTHGDHVAGGVLGMIVGGGGLGVVVAVVGSAFVPVAVAAGAGALLGGAAGWGIMMAVRTSWRNTRRIAQAEVEGLLDRIERGEDLLPSPSSPRRWIKRFMNNLAKDLLGDE